MTTSANQLSSPEAVPIVSASGALSAQRARAAAARKHSWRAVPLETICGGGIVVLIVASAVLAPLIAPDSPTAGTISQRLINVGAIGHVLGTDGQGRDILSRLIYGSRPALIGGVIPVILAGIVGSTLGMTAALSRSWVRSAIMRTLDVLYAFPAILLAIAIGAALGPGVKNALISLSIVLIAPVARVAESEVLRIRDADFMDTARTSGASALRIAFSQVLPNVAPALLVYCTSMVGLSLVYAAGLSFLGLGVVPPNADWGLMLNDLFANLYDRPLLVLVPAAAIFLASMGFNLLGDGLKKSLDLHDRVIR